MAVATFGSGWSGSGDNGFNISISGDGLAFTLTFAEIDAVVDAGKSEDLLTACAFSAVLPIDGTGDSVEITFSATTYAFVSEGANAYALLSVNGQSTIQQFPPGTDDDFIQQLTVSCVQGSFCHLVVAGVVQRDPAYPDAGAAVRPTSVDGEIPLST